MVYLNLKNKLLNTYYYIFTIFVIKTIPLKLFNVEDRYRYVMWPNKVEVTFEMHIQKIIYDYQIKWSRLCLLFVIK